MKDDNEIIELDYDFNLDAISPQDLLVSLGLSQLSTEELLALLKRGAGEASLAFQTGLFQKGPEGMKAYHGIGKKYSPIAYALFDRFLRRNEEPRLPTYLAVNRSRSTRGGSPDMVEFWADPDAIMGLYEALRKDGYYDKQLLSF